MKNILCRLAAIVLSLTLLISSASALTVDQALELLEDSYLREIPAEAYEAADLDELFALLGDPYTYYMTAERYEAFLSSVEGGSSLVGIGVSIQFTQEGVLIISTLKGGSAQDAGLQPGDLIIAVDGVSCVPADETAQARITGEPGTTVTITVRHTDGSVRDYVLVRRTVVIPNTETELLDGRIGYIVCDSFGTETGELFSEGIQQYADQAESWIVDLRNNPGGVTQSAVTALGLFSGAGYHLYLQDRFGGLYYYAYLANALTEAPVVVLTSSTTASAAEAFAAGIRDNFSGIIVGARTYGKGVAQILLTESESEYFSGDAIKVTAYRFYSGGANTTDLIGVIPTLLIPDEYSQAAAQALCGRRGATDGSWLGLEVANQFFCVDLDETAADTLAALFASLPPSARLWLDYGDDDWSECTVSQAAARLSVDYEDRWFTDLEGSAYADEINTLATYRLLLGDGTGAFLPERQITRAEICAMLAQLLGVTYTGPSSFSDVPDGAWYADDVNAIAALGLVEGDGAGRFYPNEVLTQEQFYAILGRVACYLNFAVDSYAQELTEDDLTELDRYAPWAREGTAVLAWSAQETLGQDESMLLDAPEALSPQAPILRDEAAACLYRVLHLLGILTT